jgi:ABC-2 type transport system permease protein
MTLLKQQAKQEWASLLIWGLVLGGLLFFLINLYKAMGASLVQLEELVRQMPDAMRAVYGGNVSLQTLPGFLQAYALGPWIWIPFLIYTALFAVSITTREVDRRTMEFLLALPVSRWQVITSRWGGMALALLLLALAQFLAIWAGVLSLGEQPEAGRYLLAELNLWLLMLTMGSIMMVIDLFIDDYGRGVGINLGISLGLYVYHITTEQATGLLRQVREALPFAYFDSARILGAGEVPWSDLGILVGISLACLALAVILFQRKQIAV